MRYFSALLRYWFHQDERVTPFPLEILPHLSGWIASEPDNAIAHIIRGVLYIEYAYEEEQRLGTSEFRWELSKFPQEKSSTLHTFYQRLALAKDDLLTAHTLEPTIPESTLHLLRIVRFFEDIPLSAEELFQQAIMLAPTSYWAYQIKLEAFLLKREWQSSCEQKPITFEAFLLEQEWDSSSCEQKRTKFKEFLVERERESSSCEQKQILAFARKAIAQQTPQKTLLPLLLVQAHHYAAKRVSMNIRTVPYYQRPHVWNEIREIYLQLIQDFPQSERWKTEFAQVALSAQEDDLAMEYLQKAFQSSPRYARTYLTLMNEYRYHGQEQWRMVEQYARQLTALYPQYAEGYDYLGESLMAQKRFREAVESFSVAVRLTPFDAYYWLDRCYANYYYGDSHQAVHDCTEAIQLENGGDIDAYRFRAMAYDELGNEAAAGQDWQMYYDMEGK